MPPSIHAERRLDRPRAESVDIRPDVCVAALASREHGVLSVAELHSCGLDADAIAVRVRNGRLHPLHTGVHAVGHDNVTLHGKFLAAVKACGPSAKLSGYSAGALFGFLEWDGRVPEVTVPGTSKPLHPGIRTHRSSRLGPADVMVREGIPTMTPARALVDLAATLRPRDLRSAVRRAQSLKVLTVGELASAVARLRPFRGCRSLARVIAEGPSPTRSVLEDVVLDLMLRGGLAPPDVNLPLRLGGRLVIPDFRWPREKLVVEADGAAWHDHKLAREDDAERQAALEAAGERVLRVTWDQAISRPVQTLERLRAAGAPPAGP